MGILVEKAGNDWYYATNKYGIGSGVGGAGYLVDTAHDDHYINTMNNIQGYSIGSGLDGFGFLYDSDAINVNDEDHYTATNAIFDMGTAYSGVGLVIDASTGGSSTYT